MPDMPESRGDKARALHENLDTAYVNLAALLRYLQQRDFNGRVHVELDEYDGDIYLAAREAVRARERDHVTGREDTGQSALQRILVRASEPGGRISVYEGAGGETGGDAANSRDAAAPQHAGAAATTATATGTQDEIDRRNVLQLSGEVIAAVERGVAAASNENFAAHFQAARREIADDYPFLVSLANCVEYEHGEARLKRGTDVGKFVAGTSESLRRVVERVAATGERARGVRREVARELAALAERRPRALTRFGFTSQLERIAGLRWT
ncbi:MAG TPA: hypothetical protein VGX24_09390 [Pyrinomonadaceae bacterium]|jgi:hypothetical protein|nr:hypothetical protein [Pyrinomonadaceae bacterium]